MWLGIFVPLILIRYLEFREDFNILNKIIKPTVDRIFMVHKGPHSL